MEAISNAIEYTASFDSLEQLVEDKVVLHATIYNIQIIGEAVSRLTDEFKLKYSSIPWKQIEKMRHILVHDYYKVNFNFVWLVIKEDLIPLREQLQEILQSETE